MAAPSPRRIVQRVREHVDAHDLLRPGPIVLAVSGGTDSTALVLVLAELRERYGLVLHVAHFDHRARPHASAADAAFAAGLASRVGATLRLGRAERAPKSEDDARRSRYEFLRRVAREIGAVAVATGHTRDDQAETVLLHLVRGSGLAGLAGMRASRDGIVRPLLAVGRAETAAICAAAGVTPREDETNADVRFARNRVRHRVLPELERINPRVREAIARFADAAARSEDAAVDLSVPAEHASELDMARLPDGVGRARALAEAWKSRTGRTLSAAHRRALVGLASSTAGTRRIDLPGGAAVREYATLHFAAPGSGAERAPGAPIRLTRGRTATWQGWRIALDVRPVGLDYVGTVSAAQAVRLEVRSRRPGDRLGGSRRKVQDLFVNAKIPLRERDSWPLVTLDGQVVWIPGVTPAPRSGRVPIGAGPLGGGAAAPAARNTGPRRAAQVASMGETRSGGGKRGRP